LHLYIADLTSLEQVRRLAAQIQEEHDRLHGDLTEYDAYDQKAGEHLPGPRLYSKRHI
jgi:hypothetical protein